MKKSLIKLIEYIVNSETKIGKTKKDHLISLVEEVGELSTAIAVESGNKVKKLTENSQREALDVVICGLATYFAAGGKIDDINTIVNEKLTKWIKQTNSWTMTFSVLPIGAKFRFVDCGHKWIGCKIGSTRYQNPNGDIYSALAEELVISLS